MSFFFIETGQICTDLSIAEQPLLGNIGMTSDPTSPSPWETAAAVSCEVFAELADGGG